MSAYNPKTYVAILEDMKAWIIANQDYITDFNEGSVITAFCEAVSQEVEQLYLRGKVGFTKYLPLLPFYAFGFSKQAGSTSAGTVIFSRNVATVDAVTIEIGTIVSTPSGLQFVTTAAGTIASGNTDSGSVTVEANDVGSAYNVPAHAISVVTTPVVGVDTVDNATATTGGADEESDNAFLQRFREYILGLGRGTTWGLVAGAKSVEGVRSASVLEHFPPVTGYYNATVYIDDGAGNAPAELIAAVEDVLYGDGTTSNPGYKPAGINIRVLAPTLVTTDVTVELTDTAEVARDYITATVESVISDYINNLTIGQDVIVSEIVQRVMEVQGVYDVVVSLPSANVSVGSTQVARTGTITISYSV
jgi:uncharacterized phage protein gp47/JayE